MGRTLGAGFIGFVFFLVMTAVLEKDRWFGGTWWDSEEIPASMIWTWVIFFVFIAIVFVQATRPPVDQWVVPSQQQSNPEYVPDPPFISNFFSNPVFGGIVWFPVRVELGRQWLEASWHKLKDDAWMDGGLALKGFLERAVAIPPEGQGRPPITHDRYRDLLQFILDEQWYTWLAKVVAVGEFLVGLGLVVGGLVGIAAFFGMFMNMNFLFAGTASTNPLMFAVAAPLMLAWRVSGHYGLDRILLRWLGVPWNWRSRQARHV